jgi:hypothetical protein
MRPGFSSMARLLAARAGNIAGQGGRSPIVRSASICRSRDGRSRPHDGRARARRDALRHQAALAHAMIERVPAAKVPFGWVAADSSDHHVKSWGKAAARAGFGIGQSGRASLPPSDGVRLSAGEGTKGARLHDWAYLELCIAGHRGQLRDRQE